MGSNFQDDYDTKNSMRKTMSAYNINAGIPSAGESIPYDHEPSNVRSASRRSDTKTVNRQNTNQTLNSLMPYPPIQKFNIHSPLESRTESNTVDSHPAAVGLNGPSLTPPPMLVPYIPNVINPEKPNPKPKPKKRISSLLEPSMKKRIGLSRTRSSKILGSAVPESFYAKPSDTSSGPFLPQNVPDFDDMEKINRKFQRNYSMMSLSDTESEMEEQMTTEQPSVFTQKYVLPYFLARMTKYKFAKFVSGLVGLGLATYFIGTRLAQFIGRSTTISSHTSLWRDRDSQHKVSSGLDFPAISICHAFGATMDLSLVYHVHWVETIIGYIKLELQVNRALWPQLVFACRSYDSYRDNPKQWWAYPEDYKSAHRAGDTDATKIEMADRIFLCPRTWFSIVHDYAEVLDPAFVKTFKDPVRPTKCQTYFHSKGPSKFKKCIHYVTELNLENIIYKDISPEVYWRIIEAWAWDTFEVLQYKVGVTMSREEFIHYYFPHNIPPKLAESIYGLIDIKGLKGAQSMWNTEKKHWSFNWHRRASNMLEAMSIQDSITKAQHVLYIEYSLNHTSNNRMKAILNTRRRTKYSVLVSSKNWTYPIPPRKIEEDQFRDIIMKTYLALPWDTISNSTNLKNPRLHDIYDIFGINPEMHLIVAAFNKYDLRRYHTHIRDFPELHETFYSHKGSCLRINMRKILAHQKYRNMKERGINQSSDGISSRYNTGYGNGLQLVFWTGAPDLIAKTNTLLGRFTLPSPYGVLHGYELSGAQITLNVHDPIVPYPNLQDGIAISPGFVTKIGMTLNRYLHKPKRQLGSCDEQTVNWKAGNASEHVCLRDCMTKILYDACGCRSPYGDPVFDKFKRGNDGKLIKNVDTCRRSDLISEKDVVKFTNEEMQDKKSKPWRRLENKKELMHSCRHRYHKMMEQQLSLEKCGCPRQCNYTNYNLKTEMSILNKLPRHISNRALIYKIAEYYKSHVGDIGPLETHLSVIDLSFITLDNYMYVEKLTDNLPGLVSDLGGQLGLWLGMSLLSIFEVFYCLTAFFCSKALCGNHFFCSAGFRSEDKNTTVRQIGQYKQKQLKCRVENLEEMVKKAMSRETTPKFLREKYEKLQEEIKMIAERPSVLRYKQFSNQSTEKTDMAFTPVSGYNCNDSQKGQIVTTTRKSSLTGEKLNASHGANLRHRRAQTLRAGSTVDSHTVPRSIRSQRLKNIRSEDGDTGSSLNVNSGKNNLNLHTIMSNKNENDSGIGQIMIIKSSFRTFLQTV